MTKEQTIRNLEKLDERIELMLHAARIPGAAIAIVVGGEMVLARGYGYRDREAKLPLTPETVFPIASTTKAFNTTLLAMLVEEGKLAWDAPVRQYLPQFRLRDPLANAQVTVRDLVTMRTGLPRHDWVWLECGTSRAELVDRVQYLEPSVPFRERFQYNNLTATIAGHIAEVITGRRWEDLLAERLLAPLGMEHTYPALPATNNVTLAYHENADRQVVLTRRVSTEVTAPSGGSVHSTVLDMARWMLFNLGKGRFPDRPLIKPHTLEELHAPQVLTNGDPAAPGARVAYSLGWFVDTYNGQERVRHGGYLHDVDSDIMLIPRHGIGILSFSNFGPPTLAPLLNEHVFDLIMGYTSPQSLEEKLAQYEKTIEATRRARTASRVSNTTSSHPLHDYAGRYLNPGYGSIEIREVGDELEVQRGQLVSRLQRWHYDIWVGSNSEGFETHWPRAFDPTSPLSFETRTDGAIGALFVQLEPAVPAIRFDKVRS